MSILQTAKLGRNFIGRGWENSSASQAVPGKNKVLSSIAGAPPKYYKQPDRAGAFKELAQRMRTPYNCGWGCVPWRPGLKVEMK